MDNAQFGTLLSVLGAAGLGIVGAIRWAVTRIVKAMDDQSRSNVRLADAQVELAGALAAQRADIDHITRWIYHHTPGAAPLEVERERTPVQTMPVLTPTGLRAFTRADEDNEYTERPGRERRQQAGPPRRTPGRGVPQRQSRSEVTPNYRRPESNHDDDEGR